MNPIITEFEYLFKFEASFQIALKYDAGHSRIEYPWKFDANFQMALKYGQVITENE
jgi:hypothetical protein